MSPQYLIKYFGSRAAVCKFFGITPQSLQEWINKDSVPVGRQYEFHVRTDCAHKAAA